VSVKTVNDPGKLNGCRFFYGVTLQNVAERDKVL